MESNKACQAKLRAARLYCEWHGIDAVAWLAGREAGLDGDTAYCPGGCGKACNNADGARCAECDAR